jgi:OOP family OmpA-OmpF porin
MKIISTLAIFLAAGIVAVGCATPQSQELKQAQQSYSEAQNSPAIAQNASATLYEAKQDLEKAKKADNIADQKHYAYLAQKKIELAESQSSRAQIRDEAQNLQQQQEKFLLALRQRQAEQARKQAEMAQQKLQAYQSQQKEQQLRKQMYNMKAKQTKTGTVLTMSDMVFGFDKAQLKAGAERSLGRLADFLKNHPNHKVLVEGFTDDRGSNQYNRKLSRERAQAVAQALESDGISSDRITTRGLGEDYPIAPNSTAAGRQQNRRVEITILNPEQPPQNAGRGSGSM